MTTSNSRTRSLWIALATIALVGSGAFMFPAFIIRPLRYQHPQTLLWAMALRQRAPIISLLCAIVSLLLIAILWRTSSKWRKAVLSLAAIAVTFSAVMSRLNYFEWMFHPVDSARFEAESSCKLGADEMILRSAMEPTLARTRSARWPTTTFSTTSSVECRSPSPIERSVTRVWSGPAQ